jgi:hypothetical protein
VLANAIVSQADWPKLPAELQRFISPGDPLAS